MELVRPTLTDSEYQIFRYFVAEFNSIETPGSFLDNAGALVVHDTVGGACDVVDGVVDAADGVVESVLDIVFRVPLSDPYQFMCK